MSGSSSIASNALGRLVVIDALARAVLPDEVIAIDAVEEIRIGLDEGRDRGGWRLVKRGGLGDSKQPLIRTKDVNRNAMLLITFDVRGANGSRARRQPSSVRYSAP